VLFSLRVWESLTIQQHAHKYVTQVLNLFPVQKQDTNKIRTKYKNGHVLPFSVIIRLT